MKKSKPISYDAEASCLRRILPFPPRAVRARLTLFIMLIIVGLAASLPALSFPLFHKAKSAESSRQFNERDFRRLFGFLKGNARDAWRALLHNDLPRAKQSFKLALQRDPFDTFALEGISVVALEEGDYATLERAWLEILERTNSSLQMEAALRRLRLYRAYLPDPDAATDAVQRLVQRTNLPAICRILAAEMLFDAARSRLQTDFAAELLPQLGFIPARSADSPTWDYVVGPFGNFGAADLDFPFEPEWDVSPETFKNLSRTLRKQPFPQTALAPGLDFNSWLFPQSGTAYASSTFSVAPPQQHALLRFIARNPVKVWLNGTLISSFDPRRESHSPEFLYAITLAPGTNQLLVKSLRSHSSWSFSPQLLDFSGRGLAIRPADPASLDPTSATLRRRYVPDISAAVPLRLLAIPGDAGNFFDHFYLYEILQAQEDYAPAYDELSLLEHSFPSAAFVKNRIGLLRLFAASSFPESSLRLSNQAREAFDSVLELDPNNVMANLGKGLFHSLQQKPDHAIESFDKVVALQPNDHFALYQLGKIALERGWKKEALNYLQRTRALIPHNADVLLTLASFYEFSGDVSQAAKLLDDALASGFVRDEIVRRAADLAARRDQYQRAADLYDQLLLAYPARLEFWWKKIDALIMQQKFQLARTAIDHAITLNPANPFGFQILAQLAVKDAQTSAALSFYQEALQRDPSNAATREKIALFRHLTPFYEPFDASYAETPSADYSSEHFPRSAVAWLVDLMVIDLHDDLTYQAMTHQSLKILNAEGREQWDELRLPGTAADLLWLRTILPDGTQYEPVSVQHAEGQLVASMYGIAEGAIVDFAYLSNSGAGSTPWQNYAYESFIFRQIRNPVVLSRLVVIAPENVPLDFRDHPPGFQPEIKTLADGKTVYIWEKRNLPPIKYEPYQPPVEVLSPLTAYSTFPSWLSVAQRLRSSLFVRPETDALLDTTVRDITSNARSDHDKLSAIYNYINANIKSGTSGGTPLDTFYLKSGSESEKLLLARLMLSLVGVKSDLCFYEEPPDVIETIDLPASFRFPETALYIPSLDGKPFAFTFQSRFQPLWNLLETIEPRPFLLMEGDHPYFQNLIHREDEESWITNEINVAIQPTAEASIRGTITFYGEQNPSLRAAFDDPNRRRLMLDQAALNIFKNLQGTKSAAKNVESLSAPFIIQFCGADSKVIERSGSLMQFLPCERKLNLSALITGETRETPMKIKGSLFEQTDRIRFLLPEGHRIKALPEDFLAVSPFGTYSLVLINRDTEIEVIRTVDIKSLEVKEEEFPLLVRFTRSVDEAEDRKITLEKFK